MAKYTPMASFVAKYMPPVAEPTDYSKPLDVDVFLVNTRAFRTIVIRSKDEVRQMQKTILLDNASLTTMVYIQISQEANIKPIIPEHTVFCPTFPLTQLFRKPQLPSARFYPDIRIEAIGAPRWGGLSIAEINRLRNIELAYKKNALKQKARSFFEALINGDFEEASKIADGRYKDVKWEKTRYTGLLEIISIGEPYFRKKIISGINILSMDSASPRQRSECAIVPYKLKSASGKILNGKIIMEQDLRGGWFFDGGV